MPRFWLLLHAPPPAPQPILVDDRISFVSSLFDKPLDMVLLGGNANVSSCASAMKRAEEGPKTQGQHPLKQTWLASTDTR
jgi:hypothetical protein